MASGTRRFERSTCTIATGMAEIKAHLAEVDDSNYDKLELQFEEVWACFQT